MAYRYLFIADLYEEWNRETFLREAVPERCLKWLLFIVLKWRKISEETSFLWKNRKYTWSDIQRLAITHPKYLICENMHELSFLKAFWCCGLFNKFYQILRQRWDWEWHMIEIDPATYASKVHLLQPVPFHFPAQMFKQPALLSAVLSHLPGFTGPLAVLGCHPHCCYREFLSGFGSSCCQLDQLTSSLCFGKRFNPQWSPWGALERLSPSPFSFLSWVLYSAILCLWIRFFYKYFSLAAWRKYTLV